MFLRRYLRKCFLRHTVTFPIVFTITVTILMLILFDTNVSSKKRFPFQGGEKGRLRIDLRISTRAKTTKPSREENVPMITVQQDFNVITRTTTQIKSGKLRPQVDKLHETHEHNQSSSKEDVNSFDDFDHAVKFKSIKHGLYHNVSRVDNFFTNWMNQSRSLCSIEKGKFVAYANDFAILHDVIIDKKHAVGREGGEKIEDVINQDEMLEYYTYTPGFMNVPCVEIVKNYEFRKRNHMNDWMTASRGYAKITGHVDQSYSQFTMAVVRYEYVNMYHTMTDFYNAFLMMEFFQKKQEDVNILIVDGHPKGSLDPIWNVLFNSTLRISSLPQRTKFRDLVWVTQGYNSPMMDHSAPHIPYAEPFREFFLRSFNLPHEHKLDCDKVRIMFIWRHNYIAHPRNPQGVVGRKIANEVELIRSLTKNLPKGFFIFGQQIDRLHMKSQLELIRQTDLLIGMHGAGLTHAMFLPKHAGVIELLPNYWSSANEHFEAIARWRNLHYTKWANEDMKNELPDKNTRIPPDVLNVMVKKMVQDICPGSKGIKNFYRQMKMP